MARKPRRTIKPAKRKASPSVVAPASLDADKIKQLYAAMLGCRMLCERAQLLIEQRRLPTDVSPLSGYEAIEVGSLINLTAEDCVAPGTSYLAARFIQGTHLRQIFGELAARHNNRFPARLRAHRHNGHLDTTIPGPLAAQLNMATGAAWAFKLQNRPQVVVSLYSGESTLDSWRESVKLSAQSQLPMVHMIKTCRDVAHAAEAATADESFTLPCFTVDGNDVVAVYRVAQEAIRRARQGCGPALIDCRVAQPQSAAPVASDFPANGCDPVSSMEAYLAQKRLWSSAWKRRLEESIACQLDAAMNF